MFRTFSILLLSSFCAFAEQTPILWQISTKEGDLIEGKITKWSENDDSLTIQNPSISNPFSIPIKSTNLILRKSELPTPKNTRIVLINGDSIFGEITNFSEKSTSIKNSFGETYTIPSNNISEFCLNGSTLIPIPFLQSNVEFLSKPSAQILGTTWTSKLPSVTKILLPKSKIIRWKSTIWMPDNQLSFYLGTSNSFNKETINSISNLADKASKKEGPWNSRGYQSGTITGNALYKISFSRYNIQGNYYKNNKSINNWAASFQMRAPTTVEIVYFSDKKELELYIDGGLLKKLHVPTIEFESPDCFYLTSNNHALQSCKNMEIWASFGNYHEPISENLEKNKLILKDGTQQLSGKIHSLIKGKWIIRSPYGDMKIPQEKLDRILLNATNEEKPFENFEEIFLTDGSQLCGKIKYISPTTLTFSHPILSKEPISIPLEHVWSIRPQDKVAPKKSPQQGTKPTENNIKFPPKMNQLPQNGKKPQGNQKAIL